MKRDSLLVFMVGAFALASPAFAETRCSTADYYGTYGFYSVGALLQLPPEGAVLLGGFAQSGTFTSDGQGNVTVESQASYNGLIQPANIVATYVVTPECQITFTLQLPFPLSVPSTFTGVLNSGNRQMTLTISDPPGTLVMGRHHKQDMRFCGVADFRGAYGVDLEGSVSAPASRAGRFHRLGRLVADGLGGFKANTLANYNGRQVTEDITGTYDVNGNCHAILKYNSGQEEVKLEGPIAGHGDIVILMVTSPGWTVSGTLKKQ